MVGSVGTAVVVVAGTVKGMVNGAVEGVVADEVPLLSGRAAWQEHKDSTIESIKIAGSILYIIKIPPRSNNKVDKIRLIIKSFPPFVFNNMLPIIVTNERGKIGHADKNFFYFFCSLIQPSKSLASQTLASTPRKQSTTHQNLVCYL